MGLTKLSAGECISINGISFTIFKNAVVTPLVSSSKDIISPIFGNLYLKKTNPRTSKFVQTSIDIIGSINAFKSIAALEQEGSAITISLNFNNAVLLSGFLTSVQYNNDILNKYSVEGTVGFLLTPQQ